MPICNRHDVCRISERVQLLLAIDPGDGSHRVVKMLGEGWLRHGGLSLTYKIMVSFKDENLIFLKHNFLLNCQIRAALSCIFEFRSSCFNKRPRTELVLRLLFPTFVLNMFKIPSYRFNLNLPVYGSRCILNARRFASFAS